MVIDQIGLVGVWISDHKTALDFYVARLGFEKVADTGQDSEYRWVEVAPMHGETGIALLKPYPGMVHAYGKTPEDLIGTSSLIFHTADISATYRELSKRGVVFTEAPTMQAWGRLQARFVDPDGNSFILAERTNLRT